MINSVLDVLLEATPEDVAEAKRQYIEIYDQETFDREIKPAIKKAVYKMALRGPSGTRMHFVQILTRIVIKRMIP